MSAAATITVARTDPSDIGHREVFVALDGQSIGILRRGDTVTKDIEPGHHHIRAHNTLISPGFAAGPIYLTFERSG